MSCQRKSPKKVAPAKVVGCADCAVLLTLGSRRGTRCVRWRELRSDSRGELEEEALRADPRAALLATFEGTHRVAGHALKDNRKLLALAFNACRLPAPMAFEGAEQRSRGVARAARFLF